MEEEKRELAMEVLGRAICSALRVTDICTRATENTYQILLMGAQEGSGSFIAGRVLGAFDNLYQGGKCAIDYHIQQIG